MTRPTEPTPNAKEGDWIMHDGGPNPAGDAVVDVSFIDGTNGYWIASDPSWADFWVSGAIIAYRLAAPSPAGPECDGCDTSQRCTYVGNVCNPAAQDGTATGLEVVAWLYDTIGGEKKALVRPLQYFNGEQVLGDPLTDHATATRQLAERDARVAESNERAELARMRSEHHAKMRVAAEARALAAEADAAKVREALSEAKTTLAMLKRNVTTVISKHDGLFRWEGVPEAIQARLDAIDAAQTQRGA